MNSGFTVSSSTAFSTLWQQSKYRLYPSLIVNGVHLLPLPVRNQPLKSAHQIWLHSWQCPNGCRLGVARRRRLAR